MDDCNVSTVSIAVVASVPGAGAYRLFTCDGVVESTRDALPSFPIAVTLVGVFGGPSCPSN